MKKFLVTAADCLDDFGSLLKIVAKYARKLSALDDED